MTNVIDLFKRDGNDYGSFRKRLINELDPAAILQSRLGNHKKKQIDVGVSKLNSKIVARNYITHRKEEIMMKNTLVFVTH